MTIDIAKTPIRLSSPRDIVDAVPYLVGFQPEDSLVVVSMHGQRSRLGLTARVDLPPAESVVACARQFAGYLKRDRADRAIVVLYPPSDGLLYPTVQPLAAAMTEQLARAHIGVCEVLCVCDGRWWSLSCTDDACCPPEGRPVAHGGTSAFAAAMALSGRVLLASRKELAGTIKPVAGVARAAMAYALPRARDQLKDRVAAGDRAEVADESLELFRVAVRDRIAADPAARGDTALSVDAAARLIVGLDDVYARDEVLTWFDGEWGEATRGLLVELVRRAAPPYDVPPLTALAWIAYLQGDGAFAGIALDRALEADPGYRLARLLDQALLAPLNPELFRSAMRGVARPHG
jgi:hypothetical protein